MAGPRVEVLRSWRMGLTQVPSRVKRPDGRGAAVRVRFLVDTGALYTVLPEHVWRTLRLKPTSTAEFGLADGTAWATRTFINKYYDEFAARCPEEPIETVPLTINRGRENVTTPMGFNTR